MHICLSLKKKKCYVNSICSAELRPFPRLTYSQLFSGSPSFTSPLLCFTPFFRLLIIFFFHFYLLKIACCFCGRCRRLPSRSHLFSSLRLYFFSSLSGFFVCPFIFTSFPPFSDCCANCYRFRWSHSHTIVARWMPRLQPHGHVLWCAKSCCCYHCQQCQQLHRFYCH